MYLGFLFLILFAGIGIISYITYNINHYMGNPLDIREIHSSNRKCHLLSTPTTFNQIIPLNDKFLIGVEYKFWTFYNRKNYLNEIHEENLYLIEIKTEKVSKLKIVDFPKDVPFHPQSISLYKQSDNDYKLYILNNAVNFAYEGQERIEKIIIDFENKNKINLIYENSIILPNEYFLRIDSITVIDENIFYFTTNSPFPSQRNSDYIFNIKNKILNYAFDYLKPLMVMLNIKRCYIYRYNGNLKGNKISKVENSESLLNKGIAFDNNRDLLYVVKSMEKEISIFKIKASNKYHTEFVKSIPILYVGNNIYYDEKADLIYVGINGKINEYDAIINSYNKNNNFDNVKIFSGYEILDPSNNYSINDLMVMKNDFKWVNSYIKINKNNYMTSIFSNGIYICEN